jgi:hypothetical protein
MVLEEPIGSTTVSTTDMILVKKSKQEKTLKDKLAKSKDKSAKKDKDKKSIKYPAVIALGVKLIIF